MRERMAAGGLAALLVLTGCTSGGGSGHSPSAVHTTGAAAALQTSLHGGLATITSAHFVITGSLAGQRITGAGDQSVDHGTLKGLQASATLPAGVGAIALVVDGDQRYLKVPPPFATAAKPWLRVTSRSDNLVVKQLSGVLDAALAAGNLGNLDELARAASAVRRVGSEPVDGTPATHYALSVDPAKLPGRLADPSVLGTKKVPVDVWLDARGRPLQVSAKVTVAGQATDIRVLFSDFGRPVTIVAQPASQIAAA